MRGRPQRQAAKRGAVTGRIRRRHPTGAPRDPPQPAIPHPSLSYRDAGVDIDAGARAGRAHQAAGRRRPSAPAWSPVWAASAHSFALPLADYREPILVSGTDGVGTKLKLAIDAESPRHHRHRSGRHVRQRHPGQRGRAPVLSRLLRHRPTRSGGRHRRHHRHRPRLRTGRLRPDRRRDRRDARACIGSGDYDLAGFCVGIAEQCRPDPAGTRRPRRPPDRASPHPAPTPTAIR